MHGASMGKRANRVIEGIVLILIAAAAVAAVGLLVTAILALIELDWRSLG
jgi:hypothetical protein